MRQAGLPTAGPRTLVSIRNLPEAVVATDPSDRVLVWNEAMAKLVGIPPMLALGKPLPQALPARDIFGNPLCCCFVHEAARRGEPVRTFEIVVQAKGEEARRLVVQVEVMEGASRASHTMVYRLYPERRRIRERRRLEASSLALPPTIPGDSRRISVTGSSRLRNLTARELDVLRLFELGASTPQVAERLGISVATVRNHSQHILHKLGVHTRLEAVSLAFRHGVS
jgi:DNA-binding CsgD family transcriptional regulator